MRLIMFNEEMFNFNIENIKNDLAIEGMGISQNDVNMFKKFANEEMSMIDVINEIKAQPIE